MEILAGLIVFIIPALIMPAFGFDVMLMLLSATNMAVIVLCLTTRVVFPRTIPTNKEDDSKLARLSIGAMAIYFFGLNGTWAFLAIVGAHLNLSPAETGAAFSTSLLFGALGSLAAIFFSGRAKLATILSISFLGFMLFVGLISAATGFCLYFSALCIFNVVWNLSLPFTMNVTSAVDDNGRFAALNPAAQTLGGALGPLPAGTMLATVGPAAVYAQLLPGIFLAFALYLIISRQCHAGFQ